MTITVHVDRRSLVEMFIATSLFPAQLQRDIVSIGVEENSNIRPHLHMKDPKIQLWSAKCRERTSQNRETRHRPKQTRLVAGRIRLVGGRDFKE